MAAAAPLKIVGGGKDVGDEDLRIWLESYVAEHPHLTTAVLSRQDHIGISRTALDAYINGTYFVSKEAGGLGVNPQNTKIEQKIRAYRDKIEGTERHGYKNSFIETRSWSQLRHACNTAIDESAIVVVYGKPGVGKSRCLREYSTAKMSTMPIEILCSANITTRYFVQKIARECGLSDVPTTAKLEDNIVERLKRNPRPLFVDQANYLNEKALGTICYLWERARIPIVLFGTKDLYDLFTSSNLTQDVRAQLTSRVAMHYPLMELSTEEIKTIVLRVLGDRATTTVIQNIAKATGGNHRHLDFLLPRILKSISKNQGRLDAGEIDIPALIDDAASKLMMVG